MKILNTTKTALAGTAFILAQASSSAIETGQKLIARTPSQGLSEAGSILALLGSIGLGLCALSVKFPKKEKKRSNRSERVFFGPVF